MKKFLRSIQTLFPFLHDLRFKFEFLLLRFLKKPHEHDFEALKLFKANPDEVFLDIGTNRGESLLSMDIVHGSKNKIIGFEPNPHVYKRAKNSIGRKKHIEIHNCGLSDQHGKLNLNVPFYRKWMFDGLSSFDYSSAHDWLENRLWRYKEENLHMKEISCEINKLDDYHLNPYFIKIDVQGLEYQVLRGARETIKKHQPILLIESIDDRIMSYLNAFGYQCYAYEFGHFKHGIGKLNTFCIPEAKYQQIAA